MLEPVGEKTGVVVVGEGTPKLSVVDIFGDRGRLLSLFSRDDATAFVQSKRAAIRERGSLR